MIPKKVTGQRSAKGSFKSALKYVLSDNKEGTKRPTIVATNMFGRNASALAIEFLDVRSNSNRVKDPVWHVSLSAAPGERFTDEEWGTIGMKLIDKVGARAKKNEVGISTQNNQFVIVRHHNEDYEHIHIILNRVNLDLLTCYCSWDKNDLHAAAAEIEIEYGLTRCDHGKAKRSGYQKKDRRDLTPRVVARLEKKEQKTGETDPRLAAYREMISQQRQQKERQQLLEQLEPQQDEPSEAAEVVQPEPSTSSSPNTELQPTLHQEKVSTQIETSTHDAVVEQPSVIQETDDLPTRLDILEVEWNPKLRRWVSIAKDDASPIINSKGEAEQLEAFIKPEHSTSTFPQQQQEPTPSSFHPASEQRQQAEYIYRIAWLAFQQALLEGKIKSLTSGGSYFEGKNYFFVFNERDNRFAVVHRERGLLHPGTIEPVDMETFARYEQLLSSAQPPQKSQPQQQQKSQLEIGD